jgi:hypothetical protein
MLSIRRHTAHCPARATRRLLYRICTRSAGHLASRSDDTLRFSHGAPLVFEPLYLGAVTATPKEPADTDRRWLHLQFAAPWPTPPHATPPGTGSGVVPPGGYDSPHRRPRSHPATAAHRRRGGTPLTRWAKPTAVWCGFKQVCFRRRAVDLGEHPPSQRCRRLRRTMVSGNQSQPRPGRSESPPSMPVPCGSPRPNAIIVHHGQLIGGSADPRGWKPHAIHFSAVCAWFPINVLA